MRADDIVGFARVVLRRDGGLRPSTEAHLRKLAVVGVDANLGSVIGDGKTTARAIFYLATKQMNFDLPRHERRAVACCADRLWERQSARLAVAVA